MAKGIKRFLPVVLLALLTLGVVAPVLGAPLRQDPRPSIAQPEQDAAVRGVVQIIGTAIHPQFQRYELYYAPWPVPSDQSWVFIGDAKFQQQPLGLLGTWDSRALPDGGYALRARVVKQDGNYLDSDPVRVLVANTRPLEQPTATPTESATPEAGPVVTEPTSAPAEVVAPTVEIVLPTAAPTGTPVPELTDTPGPQNPDVAVAAGDDTGGDTRFSLDRLSGAAQKAATYTTAFFLAVGAFFAVKAMLFWIWQRLRP